MGKFPQTMLILLDTFYISFYITNIMIPIAGMKMAKILPCALNFPETYMRFNGPSLRKKRSKFVRSCNKAKFKMDLDSRLHMKFEVCVSRCF